LASSLASASAPNLLLLLWHRFPATALTARQRDDESPTSGWLIGKKTNEVLTFQPSSTRLFSLVCLHRQTGELCCCLIDNSSHLFQKQRVCSSSNNTNLIGHLLLASSWSPSKVEVLLGFLVLSLLLLDCALSALSIADRRVFGEVP